MKIKSNKILFFFLIFLLFSCKSLPQKPLLKKEIFPLETLELIQKKLKKINNVKANLTGKIITPEKSISFKAKLFILPHFYKIRLEVIGPLGQIFVFVVMEQEKLSVYVPSNNVLFKKKLADIFGEVNFKEIIGCFLGSPFLNNCKEKVEIEKDDTKICIKKNGEKKCYFWFDDFFPAIKKYEKNNINVFYSNFKNINNISYPHFIKVYFPEKEITLEINYTKIKINDVIKKDLFKINYPENTIIVNEFN
ncbi:MAG: DUF4292 domain-containing protein [bacterium]